MFTMKALFNDITHRIQGRFSDTGPGPVSSGDLDKYLAQWNGWVEISNVNYEPRFQGKIVSSGKSIGWDGLLLAGILLEKNVPPGLLEAIDEQKPKKLLNGGVVVKYLKILMILFMVFCMSCKKGDIAEAGDNVEDVFFFSEINSTYNVSVDFWGTKLDEYDNIVKKVVVKKKAKQFTHIPLDPNSLVESLGFFREVWSPDMQFLVLPLGRFDGFRVYRSKELFANDNVNYFDLKIILGGNNAPLLWHNFINWEDKHILKITAGLSGKEVPFSIDLEANSISTSSPHYRAYAGLINGKKITIVPMAK